MPAKRRNRKEEQEEITQEDKGEELETPSKKTKLELKIDPITPPSFDSEKQFKFVSWNVAGFNAFVKKKADWESFIQQEQPTAICVQEIKLTNSNCKSFEKHVDDLGYVAHWNCCTAKNGYSGTAILVKKGVEPIAVTKDMNNAEHDGEGRLIVAEYQDFYLINTYIPNSGQNLDRLDYRTEKWDPSMFEFLKELDKKKPIIWTGDLNVSILDIDVYDPKRLRNKAAGFTDKERAEFKKVLDAGYIDSFRHLYPDKTNAFTYWNYKFQMRQKDKGWRLDYFVLSPQLKDKLVDCYIRKDVVASDHAPLVLLLNKK